MYSQAQFHPNALYFVPSNRSNAGPSWNTNSQSDSSQCAGISGLTSIPSSGPSTSSSEDNNSDGVRWRDDETRMLLSLWRDHFIELKNKRNTSKIWDEIAKKLNRKLQKAGETLFRKGEQCKRRIKNLEKEYKVVMDAKGRSGNGDKNFEEEFEYFEVFNELLGSNHDITPKSIVEGKGPCSSKSLSSTEGSADTPSSEEADDEVQHDKETPKTSKKGKEPARGGNRKRKSDSVDSADALLDFMKESQKRDEEFFGRLAEKEQEFQIKLTEMEVRREREREERQNASMLTLFKEIAKALKD